MGLIIGIDVGGSITKITGMANGEVLDCLQVRATDPVTSLYGALGRFLIQLQLSLSDIEHILITGVGSSSVTENIHGIPTSRVDEFDCVGRGGLFMTGLQEGVIVSMGTGTAFVHATRDSIRHIGGSGVGGGTLMGLSNAILNVRDINNLMQLAAAGDLRNVDLSIGDITTNVVSNFSSSVTASNFGKLSELATPSDIALGLFNMVYQTIGMLAVFAVRQSANKEVVLIGNVADTPICKPMFQVIGNMYNLNFHLPERIQYITAIGAALSYLKENCNPVC